MSVTVVEKKGLYRQLKYSPSEGGEAHFIEYQGKFPGTDTVRLDGLLVAVAIEALNRERLYFKIDGWPALVEVKFSLIMQITEFILIAGNRVIYTEGISETGVNPQELLEREDKYKSLPYTQESFVSWEESAPLLVELNSTKFREVSRSPGALAVRYRVSPIWAVVLLGLGLASFIPMFQSPWGFLLIPVGLGLLYWGFVRLVNRTTLSLDRQELSLRSGPLPMLLQKPPIAIPTDQIVGFKIKKLVWQHEYNDSGKSRTMYSYELLVCQKERAPVVLERDSSFEEMADLRNELIKILNVG